jgi:hypothetical protein
MSANAYNLARRLSSRIEPDLLRKFVPLVIMGSGEKSCDILY